MGHPGLHRYAVPRGGDQEGQQRGLGEGLQSPPRPDRGHARGQAHHPREGPPGQPRPALRQDGERGEVSLRHHEARDVHRSDQVHGLVGARRGVATHPSPHLFVPDLSFVFAQSLSGLTAAMFLFLIASGLSLIFGVLRVLNFAHGTFYMLGAYSAYQVVQWIGPGPGKFWVSVLGAALAVAALGGLVERFLFRHLYGKEELYQLLFTYSLVLILGDAAKLLWGTQQKSVSRPPGLTGSFTLFGTTIPSYNLFIVALGPAIALLFWLVLQRTRVGRFIRAAALD